MALEDMMEMKCWVGYLKVESPFMPSGDVGGSEGRVSWFWRGFKVILNKIGSELKLEVFNLKKLKKIC
jgi:hypothetical protein